MENVSKTQTSKRHNGAAPEIASKLDYAQAGIEEVTREAQEKVGAAVVGFTGAAAESVKLARSYVRDNPGKGMAIAVAVGFVLGSLTTISMRRRQKH
jgi:ElaB/YqjD/DUF883 family membrane-anchored ribosome-binding protein